jgi:hypothetical protein
MERALGAIAPRWSSSGRVETMMTCDYNGWNDAPEDEREWFDQHPEIWGGPVREMDRRPYRGTWLGRREERRAS